MKYGRLSFVREDRRGRRLYWLMLCDCGKEKHVRADGVRAGVVLSCGCFRLERVADAARRHGGSNSPEYWVWHGMVQRCENPNAGEFRNYGARGIRVCDRWKSFPAFISDMGPRPHGLTLERKDRNGHYEPSNCVWADWLTQNANTSRNRFVALGGETMIVSEACRRIGVSDASVYRRARRRGESLQCTVDWFAARGGAQAAA